MCSLRMYFLTLIPCYAFEWVRKFAYQLAVSFNIKHPAQWDDIEMAGPDWFSNFLKRHPQMTIRCPQATSLARATSFNRANVGALFGRLGEVIQKHAFDGHLEC